MCHLLLLSPLIALPVFWLLPLSIAAPVYGVVLLVAGSLYWGLFRSVRQPRLNGAEAMLGAHGRVVKLGERDVTVRFHSELWLARPVGRLEVGDEAVVEAIEGLHLRVAPARRVDADQA
jgi:membrane protein implicated in regulation of membrane protease activity